MRLIVWGNEHKHTSVCRRSFLSDNLSTIEVDFRMMLMCCNCIGQIQVVRGAVITGKQSVSNYLPAAAAVTPNVRANAAPATAPNRGCRPRAMPVSNAAYPWPSPVRHAADYAYRRPWPVHEEMPGHDGHDLDAGRLGGRHPGNGAFPWPRGDSACT